MELGRRSYSHSERGHCFTEHHEASTFAASAVPPLYVRGLSVELHLGLGACPSTLTPSHPSSSSPPSDSDNSLRSCPPSTCLLRAPSGSCVEETKEDAQALPSQRVPLHTCPIAHAGARTVLFQRAAREAANTNTLGDGEGQCRSIPILRGWTAGRSGGDARESRSLRLSGVGIDSPRGRVAPRCSDASSFRGLAACPDFFAGRGAGDITDWKRVLHPRRRGSLSSIEIIASARARALRTLLSPGAALSSYFSLRTAGARPSYIHSRSARSRLAFVASPPTGLARSIRMCYSIPVLVAAGAHGPHSALSSRTYRCLADDQEAARYVAVLSRWDDALLCGTFRGKSASPGSPPVPPALMGALSPFTQSMLIPCGLDALEVGRSDTARSIRGAALLLHLVARTPSMEDPRTGEGDSETRSDALRNRCRLSPLHVHASDLVYSQRRARTMSAISCCLYSPLAFYLSSSSWPDVSPTGHREVYERRVVSRRGEPSSFAPCLCYGTPAGALRSAALINERAPVVIWSMMEVESRRRLPKEVMRAVYLALPHATPRSGGSGEDGGDPRYAVHRE
ncbi:hypothetical protein MVEN_02172900 [Mycena venus]|uniref:Uncharacterized protein n=1 Tax=Mycena venus TaxID=2733690 RepID=A0A8H6X876_9AGAR|nr:hypothetical protein MVEN_02172900 [Mycena venus]